MKGPIPRGLAAALSVCYLIGLAIMFAVALNQIYGVTPMPVTVAVGMVTAPMAVALVITAVLLFIIRKL